MAQNKSVMFLSFFGLAMLAVGATQAQAAGNVSVVVNSKGVMFVNGDGGDNSIIIAGTMQANAYEVSSGDGTTTINGAAGPYTTPIANREIVIDMGSGSTALDLEHVVFTRKVFITAGDAASSVTMNDSVMNMKLKLTMGDGGNTLDMTNTDISEPSKISLGDGDDTVSMDDCQYRGGILTKKGIDDVSVVDSHHEDPTGKLVIKTGTEADTLVLTGANWQGKVLVNTGKDNDSVTVGNNTVGALFRVTGSADIDTLIDNGGNTGTPEYSDFELP